MRSLFAVVLVLTLAAPARADVFAPADPVPRGDAHCVAGEGDVIAVAREVREGWAIEASIAGGPWQRVLGAPVSGDAGGCPVVSAAADGTAVVAGGYPIARIAIRRPGGDFGAPAELGQTGYQVAVAAATGGSVIAAWTRRARLSLNSALNTLVVTPSGTVVRRLLDHGQGIGQPRATIAPDGTATVAWTKPIPRFTRRYAELRAGSWGQPVELPGGSGVLQSSDAAMALASSPSGRRLMAWAADDGVRAQVDGEPLAVLVPLDDIRSIAAGVADDGTAVVAYSGTENTIFAVDRTPGGTWSAPRPVAPDGRGNAEFSGEGGLPRFSASVAPNGTPIVAWPRRGRVSVAVGRAAPVFLSPPTRSVWDLFHLAGDRALWVEPNGTVSPGPIRGARLVASAPVDSTPPTFTLALPRRLKGTKTGRISLPATVQCDETCDVRVEILSGDHTVRELAAGARATVRHPTSVDIGRIGDHRVPFLVTVSDRAGHATTRRASVRVRVRNTPIRSFKVSLDHDFGMFSAAGNRAVARFVNDMIDRLARGELKTDRAFRKPYDAGIDRLQRRYDEASDTAVGDAIADALYVPAARSGLDAGTLFDG